MRDLPERPGQMKPSERQLLASIQEQLGRAIRYDDASLVHDKWIRQRYDSGSVPSYAPARTAAVQTAWHEAGHAVAALAVGATFSSASIHQCADRRGRGTEGRVRGVTSQGDLAFVVDAAGQIAERLMNWTTLDNDDQLRAWLPAWRSDGGDARRFRNGIASRFGDDEVRAWRFSEELLTPRRLAIRQVARGLLVHPRHLPYAVVAGLAEAASQA